jgi:ornithine decarboxylase
MGFTEVNNNLIDSEILINNKKERVENDMLILDKVDARKIISDITNCKYQDEPFYVCDVGDIIRKYKLWYEKMPRVKPFYAVKCNDNDIVIKVLAALGTGFDCASKGELSKVLNLGVSSDRIIFANPTKPASHIQTAAKNKIQVMTFDSDLELLKIKFYYPNAKLVLRIRCEAKLAQCPLGQKFGCDPIHEAPKLIELAAQEGMDLIGISFHVGSGCAEPPVFRRAIEAARILFSYAETYGFNMNLLDIGGGFPGDHTGIKLLDEIADVVNTALDDFFYDVNELKVIAEPGRFFVASAYTLACNIHSKKIIYSHDEEKLKTIMYFITDGVYGSFNCMLYDHQESFPTLIKPPKNNTLIKSSVWGPTCDALDQICDQIMLPELDVGDWLVFENMGAYTIPVASPFNGFSLPSVKYYISEKCWENNMKENYCI